MNNRVPVKHDPNLPAATEGEVLPGWRQPDTFGEIDTFLDRMVRGFFSRPLTSRWGSDLLPGIDIEETPDAYVYEIDLPGLRREDITVEIGEGELQITGQFEERERAGALRHRTRRSGNFNYRLTLPAGCDPSRVTAAYKDGVLTITAPRSPETKPRRIDIV